MREQKKPLPGEWWQHVDGSLGYIAGFDPEGDPVYLHGSGQKPDCDTMDGFCEDWRHLPDCTGWDWEPPLVPVPGKNVATATVRVTPEMPTGWTCPDCGEHSGHGHEDVCQMAWVIQDRVPPRAGIDQVKWSDQPDKSYLVSAGGSLMHGETTAGIAASMCVRCRRKDLPPMPEPTAEGPLPPKRTTVRLWACGGYDNNDSDSWNIVAASQRPESYCDEHWAEVKHDGTQFYVEEP